MSDDDLAAAVVSQLAGEGFITAAEVAGTDTLDIGPVYPRYIVGFENELQAVKARLDGFRNLYALGSLAEYAYADLQVVFAKALDLARTLNERTAGTAIIDKPMLTVTEPARRFHIGRHGIGTGEPVYVIAEIGLNHNGDMDMARRLMAECAAAGAQAVKLQTFGKGRLSAKVRTSRYAEEIIDQEESLSALLDRLVLTPEQHAELFAYGRELGVTTFSTPFDLASVDHLEALGCPAYKISSMDLVNLPLIRKVAATGKPVIVSSGMSGLGDIEIAVNALLAAGNDRLALLHCVSSYPCPPEEANISAIPRLAEIFGAVAGFSDHTLGYDVTLAAVALGARVIEKHVTLDTGLDGPDHCFSLMPAQLRDMIASIRRVEVSLGTGRKRISAAELGSGINLRRSLFAARPIAAGAVIGPDDVAVKSPGIGITPQLIDVVIGRVARKAIEADMPIRWEDI
jgi:sialic acid synthase SpsE